MLHKIGRLAIDVESNIGKAAAEYMAEQFVVSEELTAETRTLVGILFQVCREQLKVGTRPIPLQQALRIVSEAMGDPDGVGIRK